MSTMKLNEIRSFVVVAEAQSVQAAADRLHLTQSAVSRLVQRLEIELGVTLFDRQSKPLQLTRDGELALARCRAVLSAADELATTFSPDAEPAGVLRLGVSSAIVALAAGEPLDFLRSAFPALTVQIISGWRSDLIEDLEAGDIDCALVQIRKDATLPPRLGARRLRDEKVHIVGERRLTLGRQPDLRALNDLGWVLPPQGCGYREELERTLERIGVVPKVMVEALGLELMLSLISRGIGLGLVPSKLLAELMYSGDVVPLDVPEFQIEASTWFVLGRHPGRLSPVFTAFEKFLVMYLGEQNPTQNAVFLNPGFSR